MKSFYLICSVVGTVIPIAFFVPFIYREGFAFQRFVAELFVNGPSSGFTMDLVISSFVFWCFAGSLLKKEGAIRLLPLFIVLNLAIGLSCALPAFCFWFVQKQKAG